MKIWIFLFAVFSFYLTATHVQATSDCFSEILGYSCCKENNPKVYFVDKSGEWGFENGQWCGINREKLAYEKDTGKSILPGVPNPFYTVKKSPLTGAPNSNTSTKKSILPGVPNPFATTKKSILPGVPNPFATTRRSVYPGGPYSFGNVHKSPISGQTKQQKNNEDIILTYKQSDDYMSKLQISNTCPDEYRNKQEGVEYPNAQKVTYYSKVTETERKMNIILPIDYDESKKYPVVYFLHGLMSDEDGMLGDDCTIAIPANLIKEGRAKEMIMVLPDIYAPAPGTAVAPNYDAEYYKGYDNFINELTEVIMPYMEENYPILTGRENTAVCGFSMGARTSLYIGYMKSDIIGYTGAFAPAPGLTPGEDAFSGTHPGLLSEDELRAEVPPIVSLIDCGTNDSVVGKFPESYHEILTRNNQEHIYFEVPGADHDWNAISAGLYNFLQTTFGALDEN